MSRRYLGKTGTPYMGSACHVTPLPGAVSRRQIFRTCYFPQARRMLYCYLIIIRRKEGLL